MDKNGEVKTQKREKGIKTTRRIMEVAAGFFAGRGYGSVTIREIASGAGIRESSLYNHFPGKAAILEALYVNFEGTASGMWPPEEEIEGMLALMKPDELLKRILYRVSKLLDTFMIDTVKIIFAERFKSERAASLYYESFVNGPTDFYTRLFDMLMKKGLINPVNAETIARHFNYVSMSITMEYFMALHGFGKVEDAIGKLLDNVDFFYSLMI